MKKRIFVLILIIIAGFILLITGFEHIGSPIIQMKTLALTQRLIPVFYVHPKDRITNYINNANDLFALSEKLLIQDPGLALKSALRAENGITLMVSELRRLQDTSIIEHSLIFNTFTKQYLFFDAIPTDSPDIQQFETIKTFMQRNEKTAKMIYYTRLPSEIPVKN